MSNLPTSTSLIKANAHTDEIVRMLATSIENENEIAIRSIMSPIPKCVLLQPYQSTSQADSMTPSSTNLLIDLNNNNSNSNTENDDYKYTLHIYNDMCFSTLEIKNWKNISIYKNKDNALHYACRLGKTKMVTLFLQSGYFDINERNNDGDTALSIACDIGWVDTIKTLILYKPDVNVENTKGKTPLILATELVSPYDKQLCKLLIENGAKINRQTRTGNTALLSASKFGNSDLISLLVNYGASINTKFHDGATPLMRAAYYNYANIVRYLLNHGAVVDEQNNRKETALYIASFRGNYEIVHLLLEYGANINSADKDGDTPLSVACYEDKGKVVKYLLQNQAFVNQQGLRGDSPLHIAVANCSVQVVKELIKYGANANLCNSYNQTALHIAAQHSRSEVIDIIINYVKDNLDRKSIFNYTELNYLLEKFDSKKVNDAKKLIRYGCDVNIRFYSNSTLIATAIESLSSMHSTNSGRTPTCTPKADQTLLEYLLKTCEKTFKEDAEKRQLIEFIEFLLNSGYKYDIEKDINLFINCKWLFNNKHELDLIVNKMKKPNQLVNICRNKIRLLLNKPLLKTIDSLNVPIILKEFLYLG